MPAKKKKYNTRFPPARIKKIMQSDEDVGKVAAAVPVIISRTLELFIDDILHRAEQFAAKISAKTLTPTHFKCAVMSESRYNFLSELVKPFPSLNGGENSESGVSNESSRKDEKVLSRRMGRKSKQNTQASSIKSEQKNQRSHYVYSSSESDTLASDENEVQTVSTASSVVETNSSLSPPSVSFELQSGVHTTASTICDFDPTK